MWVRLHDKSKPKSCTETYSVTMAGYMVRRNMRVPGEVLRTCGANLRSMVETRFAAGSQMNP